jgi:23S rRNA pseudouridine2605 synthase
MRLAKYLAHSGVASRRAAERMIAGGRVTVAGKPREVLMINKPAGVVSTASDTHGRPTVVDLVSSDHRLYPVGRLDAESTGLLLLTNDGDLAEKLTHPRYEVEKVYWTRVSPPQISERTLRALREGIELDDGRTAPARARLAEPGVIEICLREGRNRQVRRMCEAVGHRVVELQRVAFGPLRLGRLAPGGFRRLSAAEVERLRQAAGG